MSDTNSFREKEPGTVVCRGTLVVCKVSLVGQWVEVSRPSAVPLCIAV